MFLEIECGFAAQAELYNYLKGHPGGNLTPYFRYIISEKRGRYHVTAKFRGNVIGKGNEVLKNVAKGDAARAALQHLNKHGLPDPVESQPADAVLNLQDYLRNHPGLKPQISWSVSQTSPYNFRTYHAIVKFDDCEIGQGVGFSIALAKQIAAMHAIEYLRANALPPPIPERVSTFSYSDLESWEE